MSFSPINAHKFEGRALWGIPNLPSVSLPYYLAGLHIQMQTLPSRDREIGPEESDCFFPLPPTVPFAPCIDREIGPEESGGSIGPSMQAGRLATISLVVEL
jgi:hypothetical protein